MKSAEEWKACEFNTMVDFIKQIQRDALFYAAMIVKEDGQIHASELIMDEVKKLRK